MFLRAALFLLALAPLIAPAGAADAPAMPWKLENPFCNVIAAMAPLADGTSYGLALSSAAGASLDAHVTLIGATDAYDAHVSGLSLSGSADDRKTDPVVVKFASPMKIDYFFVDSYAVDGGQTITCPSYVLPMGAAFAGSPAGARPIEAQHLQSLGALSCGSAYQAPAIRGEAGGVVGHYGNRPLSVQLRVFVDSNGRAIDEKIVESSGVAGIDSTAIGIVAQQQFVPAEFLCTPVVGELLVRMNYKP